LAVTARFLASGDTALVIEFGDRIDRRVSEQVVGLAGRIRRAALAGVIELVPTFRSLMVHYDPVRSSAAELTSAIEALIVGETPFLQARLWRVPVCYEGELAPDLRDVAAQTGLTTEEVVALHSATRYHVYMVGFLPGYPYMGDLPAALALPRRADPRVRVPPGSVAIATTMTAIYPLESPGGWHLIGTTPIPIFDAHRQSPALFAPGDAVQFEPVHRQAFDDLQARIGRGAYSLEPERVVA
jgi:KipI family sensor histidine kinase inhibitor